VAGTLLSYDTLKSFAWRHGYHAEVHKFFDPLRQPPGREEAMWYLQPSMKQHGETTRTTILKFALAQEVYDWILEHEKARSSEGEHHDELSHRS
jgi:hypothetical protein